MTAMHYEQDTQMIMQSNGGEEAKTENMPFCHVQLVPG